MSRLSPTLPEPDAASAELSRQLSESIAQEIREQGPIGFDRFMQRALYEPGLGYYSAGLAKFGEAGDFITAPELGPVFGRCLARQVADVLGNLKAAVILEIGAGSGALASVLLKALAETDSLPAQYHILETSADLRQRQQEKLAEAPCEVRWLDYPPCAAFEGVVVANEVLDALPVRCFTIAGGAIRERRVGGSENQFIWVPAAADDSLEKHVEKLSGSLGVALSDGYQSEYCPQASAFIRSVTQRLTRGLVLLIDYGYPRAEYYLPERDQGTLICHYRHRAHDNPFLHVGLTDISAFVDFTAIAEASDACELSLLGYVCQADFLVNTGLNEEIEKLMQQADDQRLSGMTEVKRLTLPSEMGEKFKVMALGRDIKDDLRGFNQGDRRGRL